MIERLGVFARSIAEKRMDGDLEEGLEIIDEASLKLIGLNWSHFQHVPLGRILELVSLRGELDVGKAYSVGRLLLEDAEINRDRNPMGFYQNVHKAIHLFAECGLRAEEDSRAQCVAGIEQAVRVIRQVPINSETQLCVLHFFEAASLYGKAEDWLFRYGETVDEEKRDFVALQFYRRLWKEEDDVLVNGGLPREEIVQSLKELGLKI